MPRTAFFFIFSLVLPTLAIAAEPRKKADVSAATTETVYLAGGCFWGMEDLLRKIPGVLETEAGYTGGFLKNPKYEDTHDSKSGHAESVKVVYDPSKDELWQGIRGGGSVLNGVPLRCSSVSSLAQALVGTGFGYDERRRAAQSLVLPALLPRVRDLRRLGAGSLDLCAVACGRLDAYFEQGLSPWDLSAGGLIAREAGARVAGLHGREAGFNLVLAAGPGVFDALHELLASCDADADPLA